MPDEKDREDMAGTLNEFRRSCFALCELLKRNRPLDTIETLLIDHHLQMVELAYFQWNQNNKARQ